MVSCRIDFRTPAERERQLLASCVEISDPAIVGKVVNQNLVRPEFWPARRRLGSGFERGPPGSRSNSSARRAGIAGLPDAVASTTPVSLSWSDFDLLTAYSISCARFANLSAAFLGLSPD
jgi:hypothetical protein